MDRFDAFLMGESNTLTEEPLAKQASDPLDAFLNGETDELPQVGAVTSAASSLARGVTSEGILMQGQGLANLGSQVVPAAGAIFTPEGDQLFGEIRALNRQIDLLDQAGMDAYDLREERSQKVKQWEALTAQNPREAQLKGVAQKLGQARETVREALPVDPAFQASLGGQVLQGFGQMVGSLPLYAIPYAGLAAGPLASVGQIYQEGYDEALALTGDEGKAHEAGLNNLPAAAFEVLGDKLALGKALKAMKGKARIRDLATGVAATMASEGATEGLQTFWQNLNAKYLSRYDPDRLLDDEVIDSILVGAIVGGGTTGVVSLPAGVSELRNQSREKAEGRRLKDEAESREESTRPERPGEKAEGGRLKAERLEPITDDGLLKSLEQVLSEQGSDRLRRKVEPPSEEPRAESGETFETAKPVKPDAETRANRLESRIEELRKSKDLPFERSLQRELERSERELQEIQNPGAALQERLQVVRDGFQWPEGLDRPKDGLPLRRNKKKQRIRFADPLEEALYTIVKHPRKAGTARLKSRLTTGLGLSEEEVLFAGEQIRDAVFAQSDAQGDGRLFIEPTLLSSQNAGSRLADLTRRAASFKADPAAKEAALSALKENSEKLIGQEAGRKARVKDERARMRAIERTGIDPETGEIADITRISDEELDKILEETTKSTKGTKGVSPEDAQAELERRIREAEQESAFEEREELGQVLPEIGLPTPKRAAGSGLSTEFAELREFFNKGQGLRIFKSKAWEETDYLDAYRERGFAFETLDDLIEAVKQTARGEKVYAAPENDVAFSRRDKSEKEIASKHSPGQEDSQSSAEKVPPPGQFKLKLIPQRFWHGESLKLLEDGTIEAAVPPGVIDPWSKKIINQKINDFLMKWDESPNIYWRGTNNKDELKNLTKIISKNHAENRQEGGLSVSRGFGGSAFHGYDYFYQLTGDEVGTGSDGEPLLKNPKALTPLMDIWEADALKESQTSYPPGWNREKVREFLRNGIPVDPYAPDSSGAQFAQRPTQEQQAETSRKAAEWQANLERIAPGVMRDFRLQFGDPEQLVRAGIVRRENLTGEEEAAYLAAQKTFYLFDQALRRNPDEVTRLNALHEMGHAFWDRLTLDEKERLRQIRQEEQASKSGPLFDKEGNPVKHLALGVWEDTPYGEAEWFAERMAHANDSWAKRRIRDAGRGARDEGLFEQLAARFRAFLEQIRSLVEKLPGVLPEEIRNFRKFLDQGERWNEGQRLEVRGQRQLSFAQREGNQDDASEQFRRLEKRRDELLNAGNEKAARSLNAQVSELRQRMIQEQLEAAREQPADLPELDPQLLPKLQEQETATFKPDPRTKTFFEGLRKFFGGFKSSTPEVRVTHTENAYDTGLDGQAKKSKDPAWFKAGVRQFQAANDRVRREAETEIADILDPIVQIGREEGIDPDRTSRYDKLVRKRKGLREQRKPVPDSLNKEIAELASAIETVPYELFRKAIYYGDLFYRSKLTGRDGEPLQLPNGLNAEQVKQRLGDLYRKIGKSPHKAAILESMKRHYAWVEAMQQDLEARGFVIPEELRNPLYFRHLVLDYTNGRLERVQATTENDFRAYLQDLAGSAREIETDYLTAMYQHAVEVKAHNRRQDIVESYFEPYNIADVLQQQLEAEGEETGRKVGPNAWKYLPEEELPDGFVYYEPDSRLALRPEYLIDPNALARELGENFRDSNLLNELRRLGLDINLKPEDIRETLALASKTRWIIPQEIAEALTGIVRREAADRAQRNFGLNTPLNLWKRNILFAPWNWVRYEFNNVATDLTKLLQADPRVFQELIPALDETIRFFEGNEESVSSDFRKAVELGVVDSVTAHEVETLKELKKFRDFLTKEKRIGAIARQMGSLTVRGSRIREGAFRYAKFRADLDRIRNGARPVYAGAFWKDVEALPDSYHKAELISKRTFGDYGDISVNGAWLAKNLVPFYRWMEINFRYHANLLRNLRDMTTGEMPNQRKAVIGTLLRTALPVVAVYAWNHSDDREELEETLSAEDKRRFHIILGKDDDGRTMVVYAPTALGDVMRWFGGQAGMQLFGEYLRQDIDLPTMVSEYGRTATNDFVNSAVQGIRPELKSIYTVLSKKEIFPDVFEQRTIPQYDLYWGILRNMTDGFTSDLIRRATDQEYYASKDSWDWASQIILQVRRRDPEAWSYYTIRDKVEDFLEEERGTSREYGSYNAPHSQVLRNFRRAINNADVQGALIFYDKLLEYGYTSEQLRGSILGQDPLSGLSKGDGLRQSFVAGLTPAEKKQLEAAYRYYARIASSKGKESILFPSDRASHSYRQAYQGRPDLLMDLIRKSETLTEAEADRAAELLLQQSLR